MISYIPHKTPYLALVNEPADKVITNHRSLNSFMILTADIIPHRIPHLGLD